MSYTDVTVSSKSYVFDPRPRFPFRIAAKRYWTGEHPDAIDPPKENALTLVLCHATGYHKEHWEPTIQRVYSHEQASGKLSVKIHDIWALDAPNQGDSAALNEDILTWGYNIFSWEDYGRSVHAFLAGLGTGVDVNFSNRNLVLVGHSLGGVAVMLATTYYPLLKISSLQLFEPMVLGEKGQTWGHHLGKNMEVRRDIWVSKGEALQSFKTQPTWRTWDERILKIYVEHGLRPLPTKEYPHLKDGVTLKCTRKQDAACFGDYRSTSIAYRLMPYLLKEVPTHITYGEVIDFVPKDIQEDVLYVGSGGIENFASVNRLSGAGHLIVQTHPDAVGDVVWKSLRQSHSHDRRCTQAASFQQSHHVSMSSRVVAKL